MLKMSLRFGLAIAAFIAMFAAASFRMPVARAEYPRRWVDLSCQNGGPCYQVHCFNCGGAGCEDCNPENPCNQPQCLPPK